ncbi:MAG: universal stress protein, partial [Chloroflexi bacterium]|nr:universal stress protein [Chloroflexota bacterium]
LYQGHLETAKAMAEKAGQKVEATLLEGKPFQRVLDHADKRKPWLLVAGRYGLHRTEYADVGSTSENLARQAKCSVLVVTGELTPENGRPGQTEAPPGLSWTPEAEARLENIPSFARGMARQAIDEYARRHGYSQVTAEVMREAREEMGM